MFDFIEGPVERQEPGKIIISHNKIGYSIDVPISIGEGISAKQNLRLYVHLIIRDELPTLYGFISIQQRQVFRAIIAVSGIGPRMALHILATFTVPQLAVNIDAGDLEQLTRVPKLGKKKAQHLITELAGKLPREGAEPAPNSEAEKALVALGYKKQEAAAVIAKIKTQGLTSEQVVRQALQNLTQK